MWRLALGVPTLLLVLLVVWVMLVGGVNNDTAPFGEPAPGEPWTGAGNQGLTQVEAEAFAEFPLLWLGPAFEGYNLQAIVTREGPPFPQNSPWPKTEVIFAYGTCRHDGGFLQRDDCSGPIPILLFVRSVCSDRPLGELETVRGAAVRLRSSGQPSVSKPSTSIWTGGTRVIIEVDSIGDRADAIVQQLQGLGANRVQPGDTLPAPDLSLCIF